METLTIFIYPTPTIKESTRTVESWTTLPSFTTPSILLMLKRLSLVTLIFWKIGMRSFISLLSSNAVVSAPKATSIRKIANLPNLRLLQPLYLSWCGWYCGLEEKVGSTLPWFFWQPPILSPTSYLLKVSVLSPIQRSTSCQHHRVHHLCNSLKRQQRKRCFKPMVIPKLNFQTTQ